MPWRIGTGRIDPGDGSGDSFDPEPRTALQCALRYLGAWVGEEEVAGVAAAKTKTPSGTSLRTSG